MFYTEFVTQFSNATGNQDTFNLLRAACGLVAELSEYLEDPCVDELSDVNFWQAVLALQMNATSSLEDDFTEFDSATFLDAVEKATRGDWYSETLRVIAYKVLNSQISAMDRFIELELEEYYHISREELDAYNMDKLTKRRAA